MKHILLVFSIICFSIAAATSKPKVLVFTKTKGWHHACIPMGIRAVMKLGQENSFDVDTTTDATKFTYDNLKQYATVIFFCTTGDVLNDEQQVEFEKYIRGGGGFVGVHSATDTEYNWPWYGNLVGAYFKSHPSVQQFAVLHIVDPNFIATKHLPAEWRRLDEWYNFKWIEDGLHVLITIDEKTYNGGANGDNHPMSWYHEYDGGRAFYTALGHTDESYADPLYLKHLLGGIKYAMGEKK
ncbi:MAG TPA: ThuA domain-containing protein [Mucilaginibacter sp.]|jgi:type 1 glutamine amidotransferase